MQKTDSFFSQNKHVLKAYAPGRLDVMGGIADYSGSLVLQMPIKEKTTCKLEINQSGIINIRSASISGQISSFSIYIDKIINRSYQEIKKNIANEPGGEWAAYVAGCFSVLNKEKSALFSGANIEIVSDVPPGKGVSSSAAIEIASMIALTKALGIELSETELPILAQKVENLIVGAPCGLMDQLVSYLGEKNKLLPIICQPDKVLHPISIPEDVFFAGIDSGIRHAVSGASYSDVRAAAFMAYSVIALEEGTSAGDLKKAFTSGDWSRLPYKGYLANISPSVFEEKYADLLPQKLTGVEFKKKYKHSIDQITQIEDTKTYDLFSSAKHPVYENFRVTIFYQLIQSLEHTEKKKRRKELLTALGQLMYQSHASYSSCKLGNSYTNELVELVREGGANAGVYGAKITGGGSGGTVCVLCDGKTGLETAEIIYKKYAQKYKLDIVFFRGSSDGGRKGNN